MKQFVLFFVVTLTSPHQLLQVQERSQNETDEQVAAERNETKFAERNQIVDEIDNRKDKDRSLLILPNKYRPHYKLRLSLRHLKKNGEQT
jgi:hypothetical protein